MKLRLPRVLVLTLVGAIALVGATVIVLGPLRPSLAEPTVGMQVGERFHNIHAGQLQLQCSFCHAEQAEGYLDPLAQVFNQADRRACLSCHKEGGAQPFYGESWDKASVSLNR